MKIKLLICSFLVSSTLFSFGEEVKPVKSRSILQQKFINKTFITPQLKKAPIKIKTNETIDSLFKVIANAWKTVAPDTLKKYKADMSLNEFEHIDTYNYLWLLTSMTQDLDLVDKYGEYLINTYMLPNLMRDFELIQKKPTLANIKLIHVGTIGNTLAIGSSSTYQKETFLGVYNAFTTFKKLVLSLPTTDTAVTNYANIQLKNISKYEYDFNARNSFYAGNKEAACTYLITGLTVNSYPPGRAISFAKILINDFNAAGKQDKCFEILNTLALHTTAEHLNRDTLLNLYLKIDKQKGRLLYDNLEQKLNASAFKVTNVVIQTPERWETLNVASLYDPKKVKYILIDFWYTSCGPCLAEIPELNKFYNKLKNRQDVFFISVNTDYLNGKKDEQYVKNKLKELNINFPVVYDNALKKLSKQLKINSYPNKMILNQKGEVIAKTDNSILSLESFEMLLNELK